MSDLSQVSHPDHSAADDVSTEAPIVESIAASSVPLSAEHTPAEETVNSTPTNIDVDISALDRAADAPSQPDVSQPDVSQPAEPPPSYVKLAMRNMVKKRGTSIKHFAMTTAGLLGLLLGLAYLTR